MSTALQIDISFDQFLALIKRLSTKQKIELSEELERELVDSKLSKLLKIFKNDDIDQATIDEEVENVREEIYENRQH